ncbi:MAG: ribonuclease P protein component [Betaproteobacteria bacterium AqS2]|uniref:Ribonuclease P protein component n=1 Tax=Candidatus Amphirhobacter heronislandensis TaxID=1732024 RepID=A0A930UG67_9GAMM|nr:ribonuclease P protein component [Betaproteobacteria bacterium AqS2]
MSPWRDHRLRGRHFADVFAKGSAINGRLLRIHYLDSGAGPARLGMAVSKKRAGNIVQVNRIRRRVREQFRLRKGKLAGMMLAVVLRADCRTEDDARAAAAECRGLLEKLAKRKER